MQSVPTKLSLDRWRSIMGISPLHFWGVDIPDLHRVSGGTNCSVAILQYDWQTPDRVGRDQIAQAIREAEDQIEAEVGYHLLPDWDEDEWAAVTRPYQAAGFNLSGTDVRGFPLASLPRWGWILSGGIRSVEQVAGEAVIAWSNTKPPSAYPNLGTVTFTADLELPDCEIFVYYPGHAGDERYRIRPVTVSHDDALLYTVTFAREMCVLLDYLDTYDIASPDTGGLRPVDGTVDANFLETVDVCRVYNDPQQQATLLWRPPSATCGSCGGSGCVLCAYAVQTACLSLATTPRIGALAAQPGSWNGDTLDFDSEALAVGRAPDAMRLWYYSGWRDQRAACPTLEMDDRWARAVAYLAASKLEYDLCSCTTRIRERWSSDLAIAAGGVQEARYNISLSDLDNPFGTSRAGAYVWRAVRAPGARVSRTAVVTP